VNTASSSGPAGYAGLVSRNAGFIPPDLQDRIRGTRLLVAGCGLGGVIAELAVRTGFSRLGLVDGDRVERHNLNRQAFTAGDVGRFKAEALADRLRAINPEAELRDAAIMVDAGNAGDLVASVDLVVDSVDFRDPAAIRALHAAARDQGKWVVASISVGWGGGALVFRPGGPTLQELLGPDGTADAPAVYVQAFAVMMRRYAGLLPEYAERVLGRVLDSKEICPVSQIGPGTFAAASLAVTLLVQILARERIPEAPDLLLVDPLGFPIVCRPLAAA
jgi:molybdopterin-synthase adenylyltransferase